MDFKKNKKYTLILGTLLLSALGIFIIIRYVQPSGKVVKDLNSPDAPQVTILLKKAERYLQMQSFDSLAKGISITEQGILLSRNLHFQDGLASAFLLEAKLLHQKQNYDLAKLKADSAAMVFHQLKLPLKEADAYIESARLYSLKSSDYPTAAIYTQKAINILVRSAPFSTALLKAYQISGFLHHYKNEPKIAMEELRQSLVIARHNKDGRVQKIYEGMALLQLQSADVNNFLVNLNKAVAAAQKYKDTITVFELYTIYATFYKRQNEIGHQIMALEKARDVVNFKYSNNQAIWITANLGKAYISVHQYSKSILILQEGIKKGRKTDIVYQLLYDALLEAYTATGQFGKAQQIYDILSRSIKDLPFPHTREMHFSATNFFLARHEIVKAREHLAIILQHRSEYTDIMQLMPVEELAFKVDSAEGHLSEAIRDYQRYKVLSDSLSRTFHQKQVAQLEVQFETQKKDLEINNNRKNIGLLQRALTGEQTARNFALAGIALLIVIIGLGVSRYRIKLRANQKLEERQREIDHKNVALERLVEEREWLLKEMHHRIKNNLQVVISLLSSQSAYLIDPQMQAVMQESQNRINAISLIHHKLYQNENLSSINVSAYIQDMIYYLQQAFNADEIEFRQEIDDIDLDVQQAVPIGLIINEAVTNAIKYAFKGQIQKRITLTLKKRNSMGLELTISDNGAGLPPGFQPENSTSLGMSLMHGLARQVNARIMIASKEGVAITLQWQQTSLLSKILEKEELINF